MVSFADGEVIAIELSQFGSEAEKLLYADGEVGSVEQSTAVPMCDGFHLSQLGILAGRADDDSASQSEYSAHVFYRCFGSSKVDHHIDAGE